MLPKDPLLLMSVLNTYLRDKYRDLDALADDLNADKAEMEKTLAAAGYVYDPDTNQFRRQ